jgi:hypothetical protein
VIDIYRKHNDGSYENLNGIKAMTTITCPYCQQEIDVNPASLMGSKKKTMTPEAIAARKLNASKPRPGARGKRKPRDESRG